jgi:SAM-dependent methyltransferase
VSAQDPTQRFSSRAEYYARSRPHYPGALLDFCWTNLGLKPQSPIADIGSGTGILTELFLGNGNPVFAVEPNEPMRGQAEKSLGKYKNFHSVSATAEATTLLPASVEFVVAGQAFHWFDRPRARVEFQRILRPGGQVLLIWNDRDKTTDDFSAAYDSLVREFQTDWHKVRHENLTGPDPAALREFFSPGSFELETFENPQSLDKDHLVARAFSSSYLPLPGDPGSEKMLARLGEIFGRFSENGKVVQPYKTKLYYGRLA